MHYNYAVVHNSYQQHNSIFPPHSRTVSRLANIGSQSFHCQDLSFEAKFH